ncbi:MAG: hypothetical protein A2Z34_01470 [Planctomycetes bacterium RBG_16_59_8]|nr:MAG: hypothetical protein A2Z34_01470 [Planctomycetes bacterium RBG_16_59_8]
MTVAEIIAKSSNIGAAKIGHQLLGKDRLYRYVKLFGFGEKTGIELPGEDAGRVRPFESWSYYTTTSVPMGHEILATPLQLVRGFSAIANGGYLVTPYIVRKITDDRGRTIQETERMVPRRVIGEETARTVREMLVEVLESGTATKAKIKGLKYCGKTGTTKKYDPETRSYSSARHTSTFVAFAPSEDARMCVAVVVDEPRGAYYGGTVAAPVAAKIIGQGLLAIME